VALRQARDNTGGHAAGNTRWDVADCVAGAARGLAIFDITDIDGDVSLSYVDGDDRTIADLPRDVRRIAANMGHRDASAMLPAGRIAETVRSRGGYGIILQALSYRLENWALRGLLRGITAHFMDRYGAGGDDISVARNVVSFLFRGRRVAAFTVGRRAVKLTLGPGFGPCFRRGRDLEVDRTEFSEDSRDPTTGLYECVTLWLSDAAHLAGATRAIDALMQRAERPRRS